MSMINQSLGAVVALSAQGVGTVTSANLANFANRGVKVVVDVTAITGTGPTLTVKIRGRDSGTGKAYDMLASAALSATGTTVLTVYPGVTASANVAISDVIPPTFFIEAAVAGTGPSVTAKISVNLIV
jgi:hypothetical protein